MGGTPFQQSSAVSFAFALPLTDLRMNALTGAVNATQPYDVIWMSCTPAVSV
jgi:hypothetical protein